MSAERRTTEVKVRFVPMGTVAPEVLAPGEIWVDVGGREQSGVLDHHGGNSSAQSSAGLVLNRFDEFVKPIACNSCEIVIVTHESPDLDAVCSVWLIRRLLRAGLNNAERDLLGRIVATVSEHDQGFGCAGSPRRSWPVVVRTLLVVEGKGGDDLERMALGCAALDRTLGLLIDGASFPDAAEALTTKSIRVVFAHAWRDYLEDLGRATVFQVRLPVRLPHAKREAVPSGPVDLPPRQGARWSLADGLYLEEPNSSLFKELARGDSEHSPLGEGFALLVVSRRVGEEHNESSRFRHIISTDPLTGLHLQGLGGLLEEAEQRREDQLGSIADGRERLGEGKGRFGIGIESPWYDGRGHDFTIVDSPVVRVAGRETCSSLLTPTDVLDVVWEYGDPARHITALEAEVMLMVPVDGTTLPDEQWKACSVIAEARQDLLPECAAALTSLTITTPTMPRKLWRGPLSLVEEQLWETEGGAAVWVGRFAVDEVLSFKGLAAVVSTLRYQAREDTLPPGLAPVHEKDVLHVVTVRARPREIATGEREGPSALGIYRLAFGEPSSFASLELMNEAGEAYRAFSRDRRVTALTCRFGAAVVSERSTPFVAEADFHRPERLMVLSSVLALQRVAVHDLWKCYVSHRCGGGGRVEELVLADRERLFRLKQELLLPVLTGCGFGQRVADLMRKTLRIEELTQAAQTQVEGLATQVIELRSKFYQRLAFLVSVVLAPLAITAGFFSGTHMQRHFAEVHYTFFPAEWQPAGWIQFGIVLAVLSFAVTSFWLVAHRTLHGSSLMRWLRAKPRGLKRQRP